MFGKPSNPYDEIISKATDEKQTEMNWEIALTVWDKVNQDGENGARNVVQALQKRLTHRSANVQLFSLTLAGALVNNCGPSLHREISGKAFTQTLTRLINDRTTHESVKKECLKQIEQWCREHPNNSDFDLLVETYETLKRQNHKFVPERQPTPPRVTDDVLRREEEDLQRALAESAALADNNASSMHGFQRSQPPSSSSSNSTSQFNPHSQSERTTHPQYVEALYDFKGQTHEELELKRGDRVKVVEVVHEDWWKGELRGKVGIFPRNHVQPLPDPTHSTFPPSSSSSSHPPPTMTREEEELDREGEVFAQVAIVDRLLSLMRNLKERGEDFAENDELTDLYNSSMALRPRVVQLIRKYDQKQADLQMMSEKVNRAKGMYEQLTGERSSSHGATSNLQTDQYYQQQNPQSNGYHHHQQHPHAPHQQQPTQQHHPSNAYGRPFSPQQQHQQQTIPPHVVQSGPSSATAGAGQVPPTTLNATEEQQRREYDLKWQEYERQLEEYNRQLAAHQQFAQQQQQQSIPPQGAKQSQPSNSPAPSLQPTNSIPPQQQQGQQPQPQPIWDGQAWVWPTITAAVNHPQQPVVVAPLASPGLVPQQSMSATTTMISPASPPPPAGPHSHVGSYSSPHPPPVQSSTSIGSLTEGVSQMSMMQHPGSHPHPQVEEDPAWQAWHAQQQQ